MLNQHLSPRRSSPIEETAGAIAELVKVGYVRYVGFSEVVTDTIRHRRSSRIISDLQIEYTLISPKLRAKILPYSKS
jgi:aryl-alcohol dehydrogenase-like predicted oxidoreductase